MLSEQTHNEGTRAMNVIRTALMLVVAGAASAARAADPVVTAASLPSDAQISAFIAHDRQLVRDGKVPAELVSVDTEIGRSLKAARQAAAANDMAAIKAMDPKVRALLDRRKVLLANTAATTTTQPGSVDPGYAQMLKWDQEAVAHSAADPIILKYDAQMAHLRPGSPEYERLARLKLAADQKLMRATVAGAARMGPPNPCQDPMGRNICATPAPVDTSGPTQAQKQWLQDEEYRRQQQINGNR